MSVGLLYIGTALFAFCIFIMCGIIAFCYFRLQKTPEILPKAMAMINATVDGQLRLEAEQPRKLKGPRDAAVVRAELVDALTKAEELKAELDRCMATTGANSYVLATP